LKLKFIYKYKKGERQWGTDFAKNGKKLQKPTANKKLYSSECQNRKAKQDKDKKDILIPGETT